MSRKDQTDGRVDYDGPANTADVEIYSRIHDLVAATLEDQSAPEGEELASVLAADDKAKEVYVEYMQETSFLRTRASADTVSSRVEASLPRRPMASAGRGAIGLWLTVAASMGMVALGTWSGFGSSSAGPSATAETATVVRVTDIVWRGAGEESLAALTRVRLGSEVDFVSGQLEMVFDSGVELLVTGPASLRIESPSLVVAQRGKFWARVGERGKGFTIDTPASTVTDLGTEFGVSIQGDDATQVAVFDGEVDVTPSEKTGGDDATAPIRLVQGEAIDISRSGQLHRVVTMHPDQYPTAAARPGAPAAQEVILDVTDNLNDPQTRKYYRIVRGGFGEDALAFVDRHHEWNGIDREGLPRFLVGADYVMPFNDDKFLDDLKIRVRLGSACMLYVLFDANMPVPEWLGQGFVNTGMSVGLDHGDGPFTPAEIPGIGPGAEIDDRFIVWSKQIDQACEVEFGGGSEPEDKELGWNMYGIVAVPIAPGTAQL